MLPFLRLKWPEMRAVALELIARMHAGHAGGGEFTISLADFVRVFSPGAAEAELTKIRARGRLVFRADAADGGTFTLAEGARALLDLHRDGLVIRIPARMGGRYRIGARSFRIEFNQGEELEGCKRLLLLVCNRVVSVDVSDHRVDVSAPNPLFNLHVEF